MPDQQDRRCEDRRSGWHCEDHSGNMVEIRAHREQISDLYDKHEDTRAVLSEIKLCIERNSADMKIGFASLNEAFCAINQAFQKRTIYADGLVDEFRDEMKKVNTKIVELDSFSWFRTRLNTLRDNILVIVFGGFVILVGFLLSLHWLDIGKLLTKRLGGG